MGKKTNLRHKFFCSQIHLFKFFPRHFKKLSLLLQLTIYIYISILFTL